MKRAALAVLMGCLVVFGLAACGGSGGKSEAKAGETLSIDEFLNFAQAASAGAQLDDAACVTSQNAINAAGGVLGHKVECVKTNSGGDPADAVPAVAKMLGEGHNVVMMVGPEEVAASTEPIIGKEKVVMWSATGDEHFNFNTDPYFYRLVAGDDVAATAEAYWAVKSGYKNVAMLFENGGGATTVVRPLEKTLRTLGAHITANLSITPDLPSYRAEVQSVLNSKAEVILTETDGQTAATFFSELLELNNGKMLPLNGDAATSIPEYLEPLIKAIGAKNAGQYYQATTVAPPIPGPALTEYQKYLKTVPSSRDPEPEQYADFGYATVVYDGNVLGALAMTAANSVSPEKFNPYITKLVGEPDGRTEVHTYAEGLAALKEHKSIVYVGTTGPILWNSHHSLEGAFQALGYDPANKTLPVLATISVATLNEIKAKVGTEG